MHLTGFLSFTPSRYLEMLTSSLAFSQYTKHHTFKDTEDEVVNVGKLAARYTPPILFDDLD